MGKGSQWERDVAKRLSRWWTNDERDDVFWRVRGSGGRATTRAKAGQSTVNQHGDIAFTDPVGQPLIDLCVIELKCGYINLSLLDIADRSRGNKPLLFEQFLTQVWTGAKEEHKHGVLIIKRDYKKPVIAIPEILYSGIETYNKGLSPLIPVLSVDMRLQEISLQVLMRIMPFEDFLEWCSPDIIKTLAKD